MKSKPNPTELTLVAVRLPRVDITWHNLTVASVDYIGVDECFELIRRAPLLENLSLRRIYSSSSIFPIPNTRIILPHLHSLELSELARIVETNVVTKILDSVCLPSLKQWIHDCSSLPLDNVIKFIECFSSRLRIFTGWASVTAICTTRIDFPHYFISYHPSSSWNCAAMNSQARSSSMSCVPLPNLPYSFPRSNPWNWPANVLAQCGSVYFKYSPYHINNP